MLISQSNVEFVTYPCVRPTDLRMSEWEGDYAKCGKADKGREGVKHGYNHGVKATFLRTSFTGGPNNNYVDKSQRNSGTSVNGAD